MMLPVIAGGPASRERLDAVISGAAPHVAPMWTAVRDHGCAFAPIFQGVDRFDLHEDRSRPLIALIGDDLAEALGPSGFHRKSIRRLIRQCDFAVVVSGSPVANVYAEATAVATAFRRNVAIVETRPEREAEWLDFVRTARSPAIPTIVCALDLASLWLATAQSTGGVH